MGGWVIRAQLGEGGWVSPSPLVWTGGVERTEGRVLFSFIVSADFILINM